MKGKSANARRIGSFKRDLRPRPVKIMFIGEIKRDLFLQRKKHLINSDRFHKVIIYPDDTPEVRKFKAHIRMASDIARKQGRQVWQRFNSVVIDGKKYEYRNYTELAIDYPWPGDVRYPEPKTSADDPTAPKTLETLRKEKMESKKSETQANEEPNNEEGNTEDMITDPVDLTDSSKGHKRPLYICQKLSIEEMNELIDTLGSRRSIQITKFGIGFLTGDCILSNHHKVKFTYNGRDHTSSEQAYFAECAIAAKDAKSFESIMRTKSPRRAKEIGERIEVGPTWKYIKFDRMYDINYAKFTQNDLLKCALLSTRGFALIEASTCMEWASGSRLHSPAMTNGTWRGDNRHGFQLVDLREDIHREEQAQLFREQATLV